MTIEYTFTVYLAFEDSPRGMYDEEVDVRVPRRSETAARLAAIEAIETEGLHRDLRPRKVVYRPAGYYFM